MPGESTFVIARGFNGPPGSANGGYACGRLASLAAGHMDGPVSVTLLEPVPLGVPLRYGVSGRRGQAWDGDELIAIVGKAGEDPDIPPAVSWPAAQAATRSFAGRSWHPFPTCFACGVDRADGLRLAPGAVAGQAGTVACPWIPAREHADARGTVAPEIVWAALDCPGGWTSDPAVELRLLGTMSARIAALPSVAQQIVVVARRTGADDGRVVLNSSAIYDAEDGRLLASALAHWVAVPPG